MISVQCLFSICQCTNANNKIRRRALARWGLRNALAAKTGKGIYAMAEYEKIKRITVQLEDDHLLLVTTEVEASLDQILILQRITSDASTILLLYLPPYSSFRILN